MGFQDEEEMPLLPELPDEIEVKVRRLPLVKQEIWLQAYNEAFEETGDKHQAQVTAWAEATSAPPQ